MRRLVRTKSILYGTTNRPYGEVQNSPIGAVRALSLSVRANSHIGKQIVVCPSTVTINPQLTNGSATSGLVILGPLGKLDLQLMPFVKVTQYLPPTDPSITSSFSHIIVEVTDSSIKSQRAIWGLSRSLLANAVKGVSEGYNLPVRLVGVGFRATVEDISKFSRLATGSVALAPGTKQRLNMKLGFAHAVTIDVPPNLIVAAPSTTNIIISGIDKQKVGEFAARIRKWRKPEPYNGKGIFVGDETIRKKEVKKK